MTECLTAGMLYYCWWLVASSLQLSSDEQHQHSITMSEIIIFFILGYICHLLKRMALSYNGVRLCVVSWSWW